MLRLFTINHPFSYGLLLALVILVRIPSFHGNHFSTDESFYLLAAEEIVDGGTQYIDTWDNKPPLIIWFYSFFVWVFGSVALTAVRIFTIIYLLICALLLNQMVQQHRILKGFTILPGILFILLSSIPWYAQEMNGELLMTLPVMLAFYNAFQIRERAPENARYMIFAGVMLGLAFMIKYQAIFLMIGLLLGYLLSFPPRIADIFSYMGGIILSVGMIIIGVYFSGAIYEYWDLGILYNLDYIMIGANPGENVSPLSNLWQYTQLWGVFFLLALVGATHYRLNYFTHSIRLRKVEAMLLFWFGASLITVLSGSGRLYLHYFYLVLPAMVIYASKFFELNLRGWMLNLIFLAALAWPMVTFGHYLVCANPDSFEFVSPILSEGGWTKSRQKLLNEPHPLAKHLDPEEISGALVLDFEPELYLQLGLKPVSKYLNFSVAFYKFDLFEHNKGESLISRWERPGDIWEELHMELPAVILDRKKEGFDLFPQMQAKLPLLLGGYEKQVVGEWNIYRLRPGS